MDFLINEQQLRIILQEQDKSKMTDYMKELYSFTTNVVNKVAKKYELNLKMLMTWGTAVGGLLMPLDRYLMSGNFEMSDSERFLVLAGVASIIFFENKRIVSKIIKKIKDEVLEDIFDISLNKAVELKNTFFEFLNSLNLSISTFIDIMAYSFLLPILTDIHSVATNVTDVNEAAMMISKRLLASGVVAGGGTLLNSIIKKLIKRFK
jgi:methyl-accepting chemotaxis protein